jgi:hypothetical protein
VSDRSWVCDLLFVSPRGQFGTDQNSSELRKKVDGFSVILVNGSKLTILPAANG